MVKQARVTAKNNDRYKGVGAATKGLLFFAVPYQGGHGAALGAIAKNIVRPLTGENRNDLVESLKRNSLFQESLAEHFKERLEDYRVFSFVETKGTEIFKPFGRTKRMVCLISFINGIRMTLTSCLDHRR